jgi:hypothetical protein
MSSGKGSRKLFSTTNLYCFALIKNLLALDAPVDAIHEMLANPLIAEELFWLRKDWLVITRNRDERASYAISLQTERQIKVPVASHSQDFSIYAVNLKSTAAELSLTPDTYIAANIRSAIDTLREESRKPTNADRSEKQSNVTVESFSLERAETNPPNSVRRSPSAPQKRHGAFDNNRSR